MTIETRDFGEMQLDETQIVEFVSPIFGFEDLKEFVFLSDDETGAGIMWLQSVKEKDICFILLDPEEVKLNYSPELPLDVAELLQLEKAPILRVIAVVPEDFKDATVNLKSPIVVNPEKRIAAQVVLDGEYSIRTPLFEKKEAK